MESESIRFDSKVMNKSNLMFIIEDTNNNKFGCYVSSTINQCSDSSWINDSNSFVFSLNSNNKIIAFEKYNIQSNYIHYAFRLYQKSSDTLFGIGYGSAHTIRIYKENSKSSSYCSQYNDYYDYHGKSNAVRGSTGSFTPKRITVIQMK